MRKRVDFEETVWRKRIYGISILTTRCEHGFVPIWNTIISVVNLNRIAWYLRIGMAYNITSRNFR